MLGTGNRFLQATHRLQLQGSWRSEQSNTFYVSWPYSPPTRLPELLLNKLAKHFHPCGQRILILSAAPALEFCHKLVWFLWLLLRLNKLDELRSLLCFGPLQPGRGKSAPAFLVIYEMWSLWMVQHGYISIFFLATLCLNKKYKFNDYLSRKNN